MVFNLQKTHSQQIVGFRTTHLSRYIRIITHRKIAIVQRDAMRGTIGMEQLARRQKQTHTSVVALSFYSLNLKPPDHHHTVITPRQKESNTTHCWKKTNDYTPDSGNSKCNGVVPAVVRRRTARGRGQGEGETRAHPRAPEWRWRWSCGWLRRWCCRNSHRWDCQATLLAHTLHSRCSCQWSSSSPSNAHGLEFKSLDNWPPHQIRVSQEREKKLENQTATLQNSLSSTISTCTSANSEFVQTKISRIDAPLTTPPNRNVTGGKIARKPHHFSPKHSPQQFLLVRAPIQKFSKPKFHGLSFSFCSFISP